MPRSFLSVLTSGRGAPVVTILVLCAAWYATAASGAVSTLLLPDPVKVLYSLVNSFTTGEIWPHLYATVSGALIGYVIGSAIALTLAALSVTFKIVDRLLWLPAICFQAIPKIALAPLMLIWVGFGRESTIVLVALSSFYPVFVNSYSGLRSVDESYIRMLTAFGAGRTRMLFNVRLPAAAGQIFSGLEVSIVFALISAVVMEFVASSFGLGYLIVRSSTMLDMPLVFAVIVILATVGVSAASIVRMLRRWVVFWERPETEGREQGEAT